MIIEVETLKLILKKTNPNSAKYALIIDRIHQLELAHIDEVNPNEN